MSAYPEPTPKQKRDGWQVEVGFLQRVQAAAERRIDNDFYLEDVENVLLALEGVTNNPETEQTR